MTERAAPVGGAAAVAACCPIAVLLVVCFFLPMALMVVYSFWQTDDAFRIVPDWTLRQLPALLHQRDVPADVRQDARHGGARDRRGHRRSPSRIAWFLVRYTSARGPSASCCCSRSCRSGPRTCCGSTRGRRSWARTALLNQVLTGPRASSPSRRGCWSTTTTRCSWSCSTSTSRSRRWPSTRASRSSTSRCCGRPRTWAPRPARRSCASCCR